MGKRHPPLVILENENVAGFLTSHDGQELQDANLAINDLGYAVEACKINAAIFMPQNSVRMFLFGKLEE